MKKALICILVPVICLLLFGEVIAGPEDVYIIPISKWDYRDVDGWGFYAKNGEYSWFGFILRNPTASDFTVTLPAEVDVAHNTSHQIVNTAYKAMINGSADFLYEGYRKVYFSGSFTLPKDSTYAVFFDVTDMQPYTGQWDTNVFFSVQIRDGSRSVTLPLSGFLVYDAKDTTPPNLTIVNPGTPPLKTVSFCRNYDSAERTVTFSYVLKNSASKTIPVELAQTLAAEGISGTAPVSYFSCVSGGRSCLSRISSGVIEMNAGETAEFYGKAVLPSQPSKTNFYIRTSLRYSYDGKTLIPFALGSTAAACAGIPTETPGTPTPTPTKTPAPTAEGGLVKVSFCRNYDPKTRTVSFSYAVKNTSSAALPVEPAQKLTVEGKSKAVVITYTGCLSGGKSCLSRISEGVISLKAGETAEFFGEAKLPSKPSKGNFWVKASLRYSDKSGAEVSLPLGSVKDTCSVIPTAVPTSAPATPTPAPSVTPTAVPTGEGGLVRTGFCRNYDAKTRIVSFSYAIKNTSSVTVPVELAQKLTVEGKSKAVVITYTGCLSSGKSCLSRISEGMFGLKAGETAEFYGEAKLPSKPAKGNFYVKTSLRYGFGSGSMISFPLGSVKDTCPAP